MTGATTLSMPLPPGDLFTFSGVPPGTYTFSVRAQNAPGTSAASNAVTLTFPGGCSGAPLAPAGFSVGKSGSALTVVWLPAATGPAPTGYTLTVTGALDITIPTSGPMLSGVVPPGTYVLSVTASNACGTGPATAQQTIVVP